MTAIDKLKDYLPIITLLAFGFGYFDLYYYYKQFNISISEYIVITEILTLYLDKLIFYFLYSIFIAIVLLIPLVIERDNTQPVNRNVINLFHGVALVVGLFVAYFNAGFNFTGREYFFGCSIAGILLVIIYIYAKFREALSRGESYPKFYWFLCVCVLILMHLYLVVQLSQNKAINKREEFKSIQYKFEFDKVVITGFDLIYLGKTEKYYLFYNPQKHKAIVYPSDSFKSFERTRIGYEFKLPPSYL